MDCTYFRSLVLLVCLTREMCIIRSKTVKKLQMRNDRKSSPSHQSYSNHRNPVKPDKTYDDVIKNTAYVIGTQFCRI